MTVRVIFILLTFWAGGVAFGAEGSDGGAPRARSPGVVDPEVRIFAQSASIVRVEGSGVARLRRAKGTESTVAAGATMDAGDRLITDERTTVELLLGDGTLLRISPNSEYHYESVERDKSTGLSRWAVGLAKGGVRAVVEKGKAKGFVKFKINSPVGTMGVRGTHFLFLHDAEKETSWLYVLEGEVLFGARGSDYSNAALFHAVRGGYFSRISRGDKMPSDPRLFSLADLVALVRRAAGASISEGDGSGDRVASDDIGPGVLAGLDELLLGATKEEDVAALLSAGAEELQKRIESGQKLFEKIQGLLSKNQLDHRELAELGLAHWDISKMAAEIDRELAWLGSAEARALMKGKEGEKARQAVAQLRKRGITSASLRAMQGAISRLSEQMAQRFAALQRPGLDTAQWSNLNALSSSVNASYSAGQQADRDWQNFAARHRRCTNEVCRRERECDHGLLGLGIFRDCEYRTVCRRVTVPCPPPPPIVGSPPEGGAYASQTPSGGTTTHTGDGPADSPAAAVGTTGTVTGSGTAGAKKKNEGCRVYVPCSTPRCTTGTFREEKDPKKCPAGSVNLGTQ